MNARSLTNALDRLAPPEQFAHDWSDVLSRAGVETAHPSRPGWRKRKWVLAAAIVGAVVVPVAAAAVAAANDWWFFSSHGPQPLTEPVVVKTGVWDGKRWQLVAFRATDFGPRPSPEGFSAICTAVMPYSSPPSASTGGALGCGGFSVMPTGSPGGPRGINYASAQSAELPHWAAGPVVDSAAEVALYFRDGRVLRIPTFAAPESLGHVRFYATQIPEGPGPDSEPVKVVGIDNGGDVVACAPLDPASTSC
jgi:hypothetical protein